MLNIELGLNARVIDFSAMVRQETLMLEESESMTLPLPMGYVGIQVDPIEWLCLEAEGRGIEYSGNLYYDFIGRLKFKPAGPVFVAGGWRIERIEINEDDLEVDVQFKGPFLEAGVEF
jgi:outer membrane protein